MISCLYGYSGFFSSETSSLSFWWLGMGNRANSVQVGTDDRIPFPEFFRHISELPTYLGTQTVYCFVNYNTAC